MGKKKTEYVLVNKDGVTCVLEHDDFRLDTLEIIGGRYRKDTSKKIKEQYGDKAIGVYSTLDGEVYIVYTDRSAVKCTE